MYTHVIRKVRTVSEVCPDLADSTSGATAATGGVYPSRSGLRAATHALTLQRPFLGPHSGHRFHLAYGHGVTMHTHASSQRANAALRSEAAVASA